jgi:hypothetical protein
MGYDFIPDPSSISDGIGEALAGMAGPGVRLHSVTPLTMAFGNPSAAATMGVILVFEAEVGG